MLDSSRGLIDIGSPHPVPETLERLKKVVRSKGIPILAQIDHSGDAARVGLKMNPTELLIFGHAKSGTPLMVASPTVAIDLPLKVLVWQDKNGGVWLSYNSPEYLGSRHSIPQELLQKIAVIDVLCEEAVKP